MKEKISNEVRAVLMEAIIAGGHHHCCDLERWNDRNKYLPATHPARKHAPACNCWVSRAEALLKP